MSSSDLPLATSEIQQEVQIRRLATTGQAALPPATVMQHWEERVRAMGDKPALHAKIIPNVRVLLLCKFVVVVAIAASFGLPMCLGNL